MKKHLFLIPAFAVLFAACGNDNNDDPIEEGKNNEEPTELIPIGVTNPIENNTFTLDAKLIPMPSDGKLISDADFDQYLKNNYFAEYPNGRCIEQNGTLSTEDFWSKICGIGTDGYFFAEDSAFQYTLYVDYDPSIPFIKNGLTYSNSKAVVSYPRETLPELKIVKADSKGFTAIRLIGVKGDGTPSYLYSSFLKVSESDFKKLLEE